MLWFIFLYVWLAVYLCWVEAGTPAESDFDSAAWGYSDNLSHFVFVLCLWGAIKVHVLWWVRAKETNNKQASQPENKETFMYD